MVKKRTNILLQLIAISILVNLSACSRLDGFFDTKSRVNYQNNRTVKVLDFPPDLTSPEFDKEFDLPSGVSNTVSMRTGGVISRTRVGGATAAISTSIGRVAQQPQVTNARSLRKLSSLTNQGGETVLRINDTYPRSLILTDIMLDRMKFTVLNRANSVYLVKYNGQDVLAEKKKSNLLSNGLEYFKSLTGGRSNKVLANGGLYQVSIKNQRGVPLVRFRNEDGQRLPSGHNTKILTLLDAEFNRQGTQASQNRQVNSTPVARSSSAMPVGRPVARVPQAPQTQNNRRLAKGNLSDVRSLNGSSVLQIYDTYPRSLILMDIMLERIGFTVTSRNSAAGIYTVQSSEEKSAKKGWLSRAKSAVGLSDKGNSQTYQVHIKNKQSYSLVSFMTENGQVLPAASHMKLLTQLNNAFNR